MATARTEAARAKPSDARTREIRVPVTLLGACLFTAACGATLARSAPLPLERQTVATTTTAPPLAPTSTASPTSLPAPPAHFDVATMTLPLVDRSRPTISRGQIVSGHRALTTLVWYPTSPGRWPLVVFAHGFQVGPAPYEHLCRAWAAAGYAVAAPEFPLTDAKVAGAALDENDIANQPADVAFVVSSLVAPTSPLATHVDASRVAVAGHSDGAVTALGVAAARTIALRAVIAMSGAPVAGTEPNPPLLVAQGDEDTVNPPATGRSVYEQAHRPRFLLSLLGGGHMAPILSGTRWQAVVDEMTVDFLDRYVSGRTSSDAALLRDADPGASSLIADP